MSRSVRFGCHGSKHDVVCASALIDLLGAIAADSGADGRAANLTGAAEALLERAGASAKELEGARAVYAATIEQARERTGLPSWRAAVAHGAALGFEEAVEYALGEDPPTARTQRVGQVL